MNSAFFRLFARQADVQLRMRMLNLYSLLIFFLQPAVFSGVGMILSRAAGNAAPDLVYSVIGGGIMGMWSGLVFSSTYDIRTDRREGLLELIIGSPTSLRRVEGIRTFTNIAASLVSLAAALIVAFLIFDYSLLNISALTVILSLLIVLFGLWCMGVFLANFLVWSRLSGSFVDYLEMPIAVLCGFMYPISVLPAWMQSISVIFPIRWGLAPLQAALQGSPLNTEMLVNWLIGLGVSLVYLLAARWLDSKVHNMVRVTGEFSSI
jgi:ABC-2 type transport system permease protein